MLTRISKLDDWNKELSNEVAKAKQELTLKEADCMRLLERDRQLQQQVQQSNSLREEVMNKNSFSSSETIAREIEKVRQRDRTIEQLQKENGVLREKVSQAYDVVIPQLARDN